MTIKNGTRVRVMSDKDLRGATGSTSLVWHEAGSWWCLVHLDVTVRGFNTAKLLVSKLMYEKSGPDR